MINIGEVFIFFCNTIENRDEKEVRKLTENATKDLGEREGEDMYHIFLAENNLEYTKPTEIAMDNVARFIDPEGYIDNLFKGNYSFQGFILPKTRNSQKLFDDMKKHYVKMVEETNTLKTIIREEYERENLQRT